MKIDWEKQEGFDPDALYQMFQEQLEMWTEEYGLEKDCDEELIKDEYSFEDYRKNKKRWWPKACFTKENDDYYLLIEMSWNDKVGLHYEVHQSSQGKLAFFDYFYVKSGEAGLQRALELRSHIEKRIREIEQE